MNKLINKQTKLKLEIIFVLQKLKNILKFFWRGLDGEPCTVFRYSQC